MEGIKEINLGQVKFVYDLQRHEDFYRKILIPEKSDEDGWKDTYCPLVHVEKRLHLGVIVGLHQVIPCLCVFWQINDFGAHVAEEECNGSHSCRLAASSRLSTAGINDNFICVSQHEMCLCSYQTTLKQKCKETRMCSTNELNNSAGKCFCCNCLQWKVSQWHFIHSLPQRSFLKSLYC